MLRCILYPVLTGSSSLPVHVFGHLLVVRIRIRRGIASYLRAAARMRAQDARNLAALVHANAREQRAPRFDN